MTAGFPSRFLVEVGLLALLLNAVWEYAHLFPFYTCWDRWVAWKKVLWPVLAILGDGIAVVAITIATIWISGPDQLLPLQSAGGVVLVGLGFVVGLVLEWAAIALNLWTYKPAMQTIHLGGGALRNLADSSDDVATAS